jgi:hypothetical protein
LRFLVTSRGLPLENDILAPPVEKIALSWPSEEVDERDSSEDRATPGLARSLRELSSFVNDDKIPSESLWLQLLSDGPRSDEGEDDAVSLFGPASRMIELDILLNVVVCPIVRVPSCSMVAYVVRSVPPVKHSPSFGTGAREVADVASRVLLIVLLALGPRMQASRLLRYVTVKQKHLLEASSKNSATSTWNFIDTVNVSLRAMI